MLQDWVGEPPLAGMLRLEELPDSHPRALARGEVAPRNSKWGQAGESRVLTTTATESIPASAVPVLVRGEPVG